MSVQQIVVIGASAGGPRALKQLFTDLPRLDAGIIVVQHMPEFINRSLADGLNSDTRMDVKIAENFEMLRSGVVYMAPSDRHLILLDNQQILLKDGEKVCFVRPSIDVTMQSLKPNPKLQFYGVVLTGMGRDGANGLKYIKSIGGKTLVQDEATSVIYGMPKEAFDTGAVDLQLDPHAIQCQLIEWIGVMPES